MSTFYFVILILCGGLFMHNSALSDPGSWFSWMRYRFGRRAR